MKSLNQSLSTILALSAVLGLSACGSGVLDPAGKEKATFAEVKEVLKQASQVSGIGGGMGQRPTGRVSSLIALGAAQLPGGTTPSDEDSDGEFPSQGVAQGSGANPMGECTFETPQNLSPNATEFSMKLTGDKCNIRFEMKMSKRSFTISMETKNEEARKAYDLKSFEMTVSSSVDLTEATTSDKLSVTVTLKAESVKNDRIEMESTYKQEKVDAGLKLTQEGKIGFAKKFASYKTTFVITTAGEIKDLESTLNDTKLSDADASEFRDINSSLTTVPSSGGGRPNGNQRPSRN